LIPEGFIAVTPLALAMPKRTAAMKSLAVSGCKRQCAMGKVR
jgi:hypothetical protein